MYGDYDFWIVSNSKETLLFYGPKPEKVNGKWSSVYGPVGQLPNKKFKPNQFKEPVHLTLYEEDMCKLEDS